MSYRNVSNPFRKSASELPSWLSITGSAGIGAAGLALLPVAAAALGGAGAGYIANRMSRRSDPLVADSNTVGDVIRVERLRRIQYYKSVIRQAAASNYNNEED